MKEKNKHCRIPFGQWIKAKRQELKMSVRKVSKLIDVGPGVLVAVENKGMKMPFGKVAALARIYGIAPRALEYHQRRTITRTRAGTKDPRTEILLKAMYRCTQIFTIAELRSVLKEDGNEMDYKTVLGALTALKKTNKILLLTPNNRPKPSFYMKL